MTNRSGRRVPALLAIPVLAGSIAVAGCGSKVIDPATGEKAIKADLPKLGATVRSVSCPSGVSWKNGQVLTCKVTLIDNQTGQSHSGTVDLHLNTTTSQFSFSPTTRDIHIK